MFVGPGQEEGVVSHRGMKAGQDVGQHGGVGVSDMRFVIDIINRRGDVIVVRHGAAPLSVLSR